MVRFLHTADWQLGMKALLAGERAKDVRMKRYESVVRVVEIALEERPDFVVLAGDTFEHHDVDDVVVKRAVDILNRLAPIPVYVLPGNHDPLATGGVWDRTSWRRVGEHVRLLREPKEIEAGLGVALYPCPLTQKRSNLDPTDWIPRRGPGDDRVRLGVAHGSLDILPERGNFPIARDRAQVAGLDYLALGDWHGFLQSGATVYSGTIEQTSFTEQDPGHVVVVNIEHARAAPQIRRHRTGLLIWREFEQQVRDTTDVERLEQEIRALGPLNTLLLRVSPSVTPDASEEAVERAAALRGELAEEAFLLDWPEETLSVPVRHPAVPEGALARVDEALAAIQEGRIPEGPGQPFAGSGPHVVREARALLHRLVGAAS